MQDLDTAGQSVPTWSANVNFTYALDRLTTTLNARYTSPIKYSAVLVGPNDPNYNPAASNSVNDNLWPETLYWNVNASYDLIPGDTRRLQLFGVVENLFDKDPPLLAILILSGGNPYDLVGRNFKAGIRFTF